MMKMKICTEIFKALSDETRIRILHLFVKTGEELCVCELTDALEVSQYNISRHLKVLVNAGLLTREKDGRWVYFKLADNQDAVIEHIFKALSHLSESTTARDLTELNKRLQLRTNGRCTIGIQKKHLLGRNEQR